MAWTPPGAREASRPRPAVGCTREQPPPHARVAPVGALQGPGSSGHLPHDVFRLICCTARDSLSISISGSSKESRMNGRAPSRRGRAYEYVYRKPGPMPIRLWIGLSYAWAFACANTWVYAWAYACLLGRSAWLLVYFPAHLRYWPARPRGPSRVHALPGRRPPTATDGARRRTLPLVPRSPSLPCLPGLRPVRAHQPAGLGDQQLSVVVYVLPTLPRPATPRRDLWRCPARPTRGPRRTHGTASWRCPQRPGATSAPLRPAATRRSPPIPTARARTEPPRRASRAPRQQTAGEV